jgi:hypothetical protein
MSAGLCVSVTGLDRQGQRGGMPGSGLADLTSGKERASEAVERLGLTRAIACLTVEGKRLPEVHGGLPAFTRIAAATSTGSNLARHDNWP